MRPSRISAQIRRVAPFARVRSGALAACILRLLNQRPRPETGLLYSLLPLALMIVCIVHAVRTGRVFPWIFIIVFVPFIGSLIYLAMAIVPDLMRGPAGQRFRIGAAKAMDPHKDFRLARRDAEMVGSVDAKRALAEHLIQRGQIAEAIALYHEMLQGQFREDPALLLGLARAQFMSGDGAGAQATLDALQMADPGFISQDAHLIYARVLELQGKDGEAAGEYARLVSYFSGEEARARYGQVLERLGRRDEARAMYEQIFRNLEGAPRRYRAVQAEWGNIAKARLR